MNALSLWLMAGDSGLRARWHRWLEAQGWSVVELPGSGALNRLPRGRAGTALLDASLLKDKDLPAVRELSASKIPVIVFGEGADASNEEVVRWLKEGADDFIPASIHERLLLAKLEAHVRRMVPEAELSVLFSPRRRIKADVRRRLAWTKGQNGHWEPTTALTETEHRLLCLLLSKPEMPLDRTFMLETVWGDKAADIYNSTLSQHMMTLRKKLGGPGEAIRTVYGSGYMFLEEK